MHGGLGRGNLGVVASRRGVGKTPLLVQVALDSLLRGRKVLHLSHDHTVDHVRAYYDEIFLDLARSSRLEQADGVRLDMERNRLIFSTLGVSKASITPVAEGASPIWKIVESVRFAREAAHFEPALIVVDGLDFALAGEQGVKALADLAQQAGAEVWAAATVEDTAAPSGRGAFVPETPVPPFEPLALPAPLDRPPSPVLHRAARAESRFRVSAPAQGPRSRRAQQARHALRAAHHAYPRPGQPPGV